MTAPSTCPAAVPWECDYIPTPAGHLFRAYAPGAASHAPALLMLNPLGEEAKSSFAVMNALCKTVSGAGSAVGRFDYLGTGDSDGTFSETAPRNWIDDSRLTLADFQSLIEPDGIILMGLRIGANTAAALASEPDIAPRIKGLILWEPILDFPRYLRHLRWVDRNPSDNSDSIDNYGWRLTPECLAEMELLLTIDPRTLRCPVYAAQVNSKGRMTRDFELLAEAAPCGSKVQAVDGRPFWEPVGQTTCDALISQTADWLARITAGASAK